MSIVSKTCKLELMGTAFLVTGPPEIMDEMLAASKAENFELLDELLDKYKSRLVVGPFNG